MLTYEAYTARNTNLNWNVMPSAVPRPAAPGLPLQIPAGEVTYHKDLGLPKQFDLPRVGLSLRYGLHSTDALRDDAIIAPKVLPPGATMIEVTMQKYRVIKWVMRYQYDAHDDLVLVVQPDGFVRTIWVNAHNDTHRTLDTTKYARPAF